MVTLVLMASLAAEPAGPVAGGAAAAQPGSVEPAPLRFAMTLAPREAPSCVGPLVPGAPPCRLAAVLGTTAAITALDLLLPVERRLIPLSSPGASGPRSSPLQPPAGTTWLTGFSTSATFTGVGEFDMRQPPPGR